MIENKIPKETIDFALHHSINRLDYEYDRFHLKRNQRLAMITIGTIGQLVFKNYLEKNEIQFDFQLQYGKYDDYDFTINKKIVEVKTSGYMNENEWRKLNGIYNSSQLEHALIKKYFCFVQLFINGYDKKNKLFIADKCDTAIIVGWKEISKISDYPAKSLPFGKAHLIPINSLNSMKFLFS